MKPSEMTTVELMWRISTGDASEMAVELGRRAARIAEALDFHCGRGFDDRSHWDILKEANAPSALREGQEGKVTAPDSPPAAAPPAGVPPRPLMPGEQPAPCALDDACPCPCHLRPAPAGVPDPVRLRDDGYFRRTLAGLLFGYSGMACHLDNVWLDKILDWFEAATSRASTVPDPLDVSIPRLLLSDIIATFACTRPPVSISDDSPTALWKDWHDRKNKLLDGARAALRAATRATSTAPPAGVPPTPPKPTSVAPGQRWLSMDESFTVLEREQDGRWAVLWDDGTRFVHDETSILGANFLGAAAAPAGVPDQARRHECPSCDFDDSVKVPEGRLLASTPIKRAAAPDPVRLRDDDLAWARKAIEAMAERWTMTPVWHDGGKGGAPFHDGKIHVTTRELHAAAVLVRAGALSARIVDPVTSRASTVPDPVEAVLAVECPNVDTHPGGAIGEPCYFEGPALPEAVCASRIRAATRATSTRGAG